MSLHFNFCCIFYLASLPNTFQISVLLFATQPTYFSSPPFFFRSFLFVVFSLYFPTSLPSSFHSVVPSFLLSFPPFPLPTIPPITSPPLFQFSQLFIPSPASNFFVTEKMIRKTFLFFVLFFTWSDLRSIGLRQSSFFSLFACIIIDRSEKKRNFPPLF